MPFYVGCDQVTALQNNNEHFLQQEADKILGYIREKELMLILSFIKNPLREKRNDFFAQARKKISTVISIDARTSDMKEREKMTQQLVIAITLEDYQKVKTLIDNDIKNFGCMGRFYEMLIIMRLAVKRYLAQPQEMSELKNTSSSGKETQRSDIDKIDCSVPLFPR